MSNVLVVSLIVSLVINLSMFLIAYRFKSDKLTDISYAVTFITIAMFALARSEGNASHIIVAAMISIWAVRLGGFLLYRVIKRGKDNRFDGVRESFTKFGRFWLGQAVTVWVLMIPAVLAFGESWQVNGLMLTGVLIWAIGFVTETVADVQKITFTSKPANKDKWIASGIWKYSRHPNYFGEIMIWIGVYVTVLGSLSTTQAIVGLLSPLTIFILLRFISGVPPLEKSADKRWGSVKAYQEYKRRTSLLILLPRQ